ncbi:hypothetical protein [Streptomyces sp. LN699]|uniref:hypothetical protein n=1 Tax=Streptomyces sp. LN699 TaxID=3112981 RepID=UPI0037118D58
MHSSSHFAIVLLVVAVDVLFCLLVSGVAALAARMDRASRVTALTRAGIAFAGALTLSLALLTFLITALR